MKQLIKNILIDLNNVGENYEELEKLMPNIYRNVIHSLHTHFIDFKANKKLGELIQDYSKLFNKNPFHNYPAFWQYLCEKEFKRNLSFEEIEYVFEIYLNEYSRRAEIYPDFKPFLDECIKRNLKLGLITNGNTKRVYKFIEKFKLLDYFNTIVVSGSTPFSKPSFEIFKVALKNIDGNPLETIFIGDRPDTDILGANESGLWSVRIFRGVTQKIKEKGSMELADFSINNLADIFKLPLIKFENHISSVLIACGGRGSRMNDLTKNNQKCMIVVDGVPILFRLVNIFKRLGIKEFHFLVGHCSKEVRDYFSDGKKFGIKIHYHESEFNSTGLSIMQIKDYLPEEFIYVHGDIYFRFDLLLQLLKSSIKHEGRTTFVVTKRDIADTHPVFEFKGDKLVEINRFHDRSQYESYFFSMGLGIIKKNNISDFGLNTNDQEITTEQLFNKNIKEIQLYEYDDNWVHLVTKEDLNEYARFIQEDSIYG